MDGWGAGEGRVHLRRSGDLGNACPSRTPWGLRQDPCARRNRISARFCGIRARGGASRRRRGSRWPASGPRARAHGRSGATGSEETRRAQNRGARPGEGGDPDVWVRAVSSETGSVCGDAELWAKRGNEGGKRSWAGLGCCWVLGLVWLSFSILFLSSFLIPNSNKV